LLGGSSAPNAEEENREEGKGKRDKESGTWKEVIKAYSEEKRGRRLKRQGKWKICTNFRHVD